MLFKCSSNFSTINNVKFDSQDKDQGGLKGCAFKKMGVIMLLRL